MALAASEAGTERNICAASRRYLSVEGERIRPGHGNQTIRNPMLVILFAQACRNAAEAASSAKFSTDGLQVCNKI